MAICMIDMIKNMRYFLSVDFRFYIVDNSYNNKS